MADKEEIIKEYCDHCDNRNKIWLCLNCFYDMRFFEDNRLITITKKEYNKLKEEKK